MLTKKYQRELEKAMAQAIARAQSRLWRTVAKRLDIEATRIVRLQFYDEMGRVAAEVAAKHMEKAGLNAAIAEQMGKYLTKEAVLEAVNGMLSQSARSNFQWGKDVERAIYDAVDRAIPA